MLSYGFGAPFVLGGPLGASDPGCGTAELYSVLVSTVQYSTVQYRDMDVPRTATPPWLTCPALRTPGWRPGAGRRTPTPWCRPATCPRS